VSVAKTIGVAVKVGSGRQTNLFNTGSSTQFALQQSEFLLQSESISRHGVQNPSSPKVSHRSGEQSASSQQTRSVQKLDWHSASVEHGVATPRFGVGVGVGVGGTLHTPRLSGTLHDWPDGHVKVEQQTFSVVLQTKPVVQLELRVHIPPGGAGDGVTVGVGVRAVVHTLPWQLPEIQSVSFPQTEGLGSFEAHMPRWPMMSQR
jgi:hypothetical protein